MAVQQWTLSGLPGVGFWPADRLQRASHFTIGRPLVLRLMAACPTGCAGKSVCRGRDRP